MICLPNSVTVTQEYIDEVNEKYHAFVGKEHMNTCTGRDWDYALAISRADLQQDDIVLDIGCASSYFALYIASRVAKSYGIDDISSYAIDWTIPWLRALPHFDAYNNGSYVLVFNNAAHMPFPDSMFDKVFTFSALEHFLGDDDSRCAREVARILKPGGLFLGTVDFNPASEYPLDGDDYRAYTYESLMRRIIEPSGMELVGRDWAMDFHVPDAVDYAAIPLYFELVKS